MKIDTQKFGSYKGQEVMKYNIHTEDMTFSFIDFGAALQSVVMPDRNGQLDNIVIGFNTVDDYVNSGGYFGMTIGRVAGRIKGASFHLNDDTYKLERNMGEHNMHSSGEMSYRVYDVEISKHGNGEEIALIMTTTLDESQHFPGNMKVQVTHTITYNNEWSVHYQAITDKDTMFNPTNHSYFNLSGLKRNVLTHELKLMSEHVIDTDEELIPTGELSELTDYHEFQTVADDLDTPFLLAGTADDERISLRDKESGRRLDIQTDMTAVIVYTAGGLDYTDSDQRHLESNAGIALETQMPPDAVHQPKFGDIRVIGSETYQSATIYRFTTES